MVRLESDRPGTAFAKTVAILPDEPFLKSSICFSSNLVTCLAEVESSSAREAVIVIVGSDSGFFLCYFPLSRPESDFKLSEL